MQSAKYFVSLANGVGIASLRAISGAEEQVLQSNNSLTAIELVDQLLVDSPLASVKPGDAGDIPICERDKLLAAIYIDLFGADIQNTIICEACAERFELKFSLLEIQENLLSAQESAVKDLKGQLQVKTDRSYSWQDQTGATVVFRLPTGKDELAFLNSIVHEPEQSLLQDCVLEASADPDYPALEELLESIAPTIDIELDSRCAECGVMHRFDFNLQDYLLEKLKVEREKLNHEVHALAVNYHWSLSQILSLSRHDRLSLYAMTQSEEAMT